MGCKHFPLSVCKDCRIETLTSQVARLKALCGAVVKVLEIYTDDEECRFDHHGYCQAHGWMSNETCINTQAKDLIKRIKDEGMEV